MFLKLLIALLICSPAFAQLPPVGVQDEGGAVSRPVFVLNCTGDGIECSHSGITATLNVTGGGAVAGDGGWTDFGTNVALTATSDLVGIGTTSPSGLLELVESGEHPLMISFAPTGDGDMLIVQSAGNVGINDSTPSTKLEVGGTVTATAFAGPLTGNVTGDLTGNADTATALAANPNDCAANQFANTIAANGTLSCAAIADADVPNTITIDLATAASDLTCTDCIGTTEIADSYLLNNGDAGTGVYDFGGADSFEIVNAAGPTVNAAGEIAIDTTDDQIKYYGGAERVLRYEWVKSFSLESIVTGDDDVPLGADPDAVTITGLRCQTPAGTSVGITINDGTNSMEEVVCDSDGQTDDGSLTNNTFTANEMMYFDTGTVTGTITWVNMTIRGTVDAQ